MTPSDAIILAVDGGNSKTDVALVRGDGTVLRRTRGGPFVPHLIGPVAAVQSIAPAILDALGDLSRVDHVAAYLANADLPIEEARIRDAMVKHDWAPCVVVENDTVALLRAGADSPNAVAVVCGAGINCIAVAEDGRQVRFPALGRITGDWGGGVSLAKEVLWSTSRAEDGRGPATELTTRVAQHFGRPTAVAVSEAIHLGDIDRERSHELIPILFDAAAHGDEVALALVRRQADEIVLMVTTSLGRLGLVDVETDIVLGGGILGSAHPTLLDVVRTELAHAAPRGRIVLFDGVPVVGAAILGIETMWGADHGPGRDAAVQKVRQEFGAARV